MTMHLIRILVFIMQVVLLNSAHINFIVFECMVISCSSPLISCARDFVHINKRKNKLDKHTPKNLIQTHNAELDFDTRYSHGYVCMTSVAKGQQCPIHSLRRTYVASISSFSVDNMGFGISQSRKMRCLLCSQSLSSSRNCRSFLFIAPRGENSHHPQDLASPLRIPESCLQLFPPSH